MIFARLGLWLLQRERASGEWRVLLLALVIGVGSVSTTGFLGDRLKRAMSEQGAGFLGADGPDVLNGVGYSDSDVADLEARGILKVVR